MNASSATPRGRRHRRLAPHAAVLAAVAVMATALVGCGSSSVATPGVTSTSILIGSHQPLTGPVAPGYSEIAPAAKALFTYVNDTKGGVYGRTINYDYQDDAYNPTQTATVVRKLVLQNKVFAIANGLGTPTHEQVEPFLNSEKVPDLFVASGCVCWNEPAKYPETTGYQTSYQIEGRILGQYIAQSFTSDKVGYLLQNDDVGRGGQAGLDEQLPASQVVSKQPYDVSALGSGLGNQMAALQHSGAKVVAVFAVPAAFALAILAAAQIGYHPQFVASSIDANPVTMAGLIGSFSKGKAGAALLEGIISASYLPSATDTSNPWIQLFAKIHTKNDAGEPFDSNTIYGMSWAYNLYQLLLANGKNLTRKSIVATINKADLKGPGLLPLTFSASDHRGYEGEQMAKFGAGNTLTTFGPVYKALDTGPITTYTGGQAPPPAGF